MTYVVGNCSIILPKLDAGTVQSCVTSPPYWGLRSYGGEGEIGNEPTVQEYVARLVEVFREVRRVLRDDGCLWLNLGDCYSGTGRTGGGAGAARSVVGGPAWRVPSPGLKPKDLVGAPWRVALALQEDGWWLRSDVIWSKPNPLPESVKDRPTTSHEHLFLLAKSERYHYDGSAIAEPSVWMGQGRTSRAPVERGMPGAPPHSGLRHDIPTGRRNARTVWEVPPDCTSRTGHPAPMPAKIATRCILASTRPGDLVLDPFGGSGTVGRVAEALGRRWRLVDCNPGYARIAERRLGQLGLLGGCHG